MDDFSKPKIAWNRIASKKSFGLIDEGIYIQDSMHFITGENIELSCRNIELITFYMVNEFDRWRIRWW